MTFYVAIWLISTCLLLKIWLILSQNVALNSFHLLRFHPSKLMFFSTQTGSNNFRIIRYFQLVLKYIWTGVNEGWDWNPNSNFPWSFIGSSSSFNVSMRQSIYLRRFKGRAALNYIPIPTFLLLWPRVWTVMRKGRSPYRNFLSRIFLSMQC